MGTRQAGEGAAFEGGFALVPLLYPSDCLGCAALGPLASRCRRPLADQAPRQRDKRRGCKGDGTPPCIGCCYVTWRFHAIVELGSENWKGHCVIAISCLTYCRSLFQGCISSCYSTLIHSVKPPLGMDLPGKFAFYHHHIRSDPMRGCSPGFLREQATQAVPEREKCSRKHAYTV